jgi:hypothetical protein
MARHKDAQWGLADPVKTWEEVHAALLMDICDELKAIREQQQRMLILQERTIGCYRFAQMPVALERIDKRLTQKMPLKRGRPKAGRA